MYNWNPAILYDLHVLQPPFKIVESVSDAGKKMLPWIYANETAIKIIIIHLRFFKRDNFNFGDYKTHSSMLIIT